MTSFEKHINKIIGIEGDYSDHKSDSGGKTRYGITEYLARRYNYKGDMKNLPLDIAKDIYKKEFWLKLELDSIENICPSITHELLDTAINQGVGRASEYLQLCLNALNARQTIYKDIRIDGDIGPATLNALKKYTQKRGDEGEIVLLRALNCLQGAFYINLTQKPKREKDEDFLYGWILNRIVI